MRALIVKPSCTDIRCLYLVRCADVDETEPVESELTKAQEKQKAILDAANAKFADPTTDLDNLVPKNSNWDLKAQLKPKLAILEKRTQQALLETVREKAKGATGKQLAAAVATLSQLPPDIDAEAEDE